MIKICVIALGKDVFSAFSINQEYPLATVIRGDWTKSKKEVEENIRSRLASQRMEWKKLGKSVPTLPKKRDNWRFNWVNTSIFWNTDKKPKPETLTLLDEPGLTVTREVKPTIVDSNEPLYFAEKNGNAFNFTPVTADVIKESEIPNYMKTHKGE